MKHLIQKVNLDYLEAKYPGTAINWEEFKSPTGQHYKFLNWIASQFQNRDIFDIGTHRGASSLALSSGSQTNTVYSFDLEHQYPLAQVPNIKYNTDNLMEHLGRESWSEKLLNSAFIFLDIDPHEGKREYEFYEWLKAKNYQGFVICDDIWYFKEMRDNFWFRIPAAEKLDITECGHWSGTGILRFGSTFWPQRPIPTNWTVVTAYFDLTKMPDASQSIKDRPMEHYLVNARATMSVEQNLVVYCEPESLDLLKSMRPPWLESRTVYIPMSFEDFPMTKYRSKIQENRQNNPYVFDDRNTASYYLLCMARYAMLKQVMEVNSFKSTHFAWLNICIERMGWKNVAALERVWPVNREKFSTCYIDYQPEWLVRNTPEYYKLGGLCSMCSGFFTGSGKYMKHFCDSIEDNFLKVMEAGYGHADEQLFSMVFFDNRELFDVYYGDYTEMITNYVDTFERPEEPIRLIITNSFMAEDYEVCERACKAVWRSYKRGCANLDIYNLTTLLNIYRTVLERQGKGSALP
jgi:hypothetical protein